ncbi:MAG: cyclase family protein [Humibacillus sp.]|nr:cyclase family protein [Humibacillus sp.]MDN5775585.1 cyclase family protein [Humibacillus sp.]
MITDATRMGAVGEVGSGRTVSLAAPIEVTSGADNPDPADHQMTGLSPQNGSGLHFATDRVCMNVHGNAHTHLDALCHVMFDGVLYNGVPASSVTSDGALELTVGIVSDGIVGRGVLLDIPRTRGVAWLEPGDHVTPEDITAAERLQEVVVGPGDLMFVRVGHRRRRAELGAWDAAESRAGLHSEVVPLLAERQVAVLGSDGNNDTAPSCVAGVDFPVHVLAINALGMHLPRLSAAGGHRRAVRGRGPMELSLCDRAVAPPGRDRFARQPDRHALRRRRQITSSWER